MPHAATATTTPHPHLHGATPVPYAGVFGLAPPPASERRAADSGLGISQALRALQARWRLVALVALQGALFAAATAVVLPWQHTASVELLLSAAPDSRPASSQPPLSALSAADAAALLVSEPVALAAVRSLRQHGTAVREPHWLETAQADSSPDQWLVDQLLARLSVQLLPGSRVLRLEVRDSDPAQAARQANALVAAFAASPVIAAPPTGQPPRVTVLRPAKLPPASLELRMAGLAGAGGLAGMLLALVGVVLWERQTPRLRAEADVERLLGLPMLGSVPTQGRAAPGTAAQGAQA